MKKITYPFWNLIFSFVKKKKKNARKTFQGHGEQENEH